MCRTPSKAETDIDALPELMVQGSEEAWCAFAEEFLPRFRGFFVRQGLGVAEAEDLAVTCVDHFVEVIHKFTSRGPGSFEKWVFRVVQRVLADWARRRPREAQLDDAEGVSEPAKVISPPDEPTIVAVREAMQQLDELNREIISLRAMYGPYSFAEIGEILDISEGNARVRYYRARKQLRRLLEADPRCAELVAQDQVEEKGGGT